MVRARPGRAWPLGAAFDGSGTNFSLWSGAAGRVELCLFGPAGATTGEERVELTEVDASSWHGYLPGVGPGQRYGYRVHGPFDPARGQRGDAAKLLVDPYALAVDGEVAWGRPDSPDAGYGVDTAAAVPKAVVVSPYFDWGSDRPPATPLSETVLYEVHVKGFTARHPGVPAALRGTYAGLAHPAALEHLTRLGVTAVELLPVHHFVHDARLVALGLSNYWGYNPLAWLAPHGGYSSAGTAGGQVAEFKAMVKALHEAGLEVILDVVYNHTAEGDHRGPTLSLRGIDNAAYYRLHASDPSRYVDHTGCGNTFDTRHPQALQLVLDSLRYWAQEVRVDGFRFDLATALCRGERDFDLRSAFLAAVHQDPVLRRVKLVAEPWDLGEGGYQVGRFPAPWSEWNGRYRDGVRDFWRGEGTAAEVAYRLTGSSDLYGARRPQASVNFVTAHDGFTLADLVSYERKRNAANGEGDRDGESHNRSSNGGVEGPTDDPAVLALRARQRRNFFATLRFSQGVPLVLGGDELGRTQGGNNNAYCQDNEVSWFDWAAADADLVDFVARLVGLRQAHPVFRRRRFFTGRPTSGSGRPDVAWLRPDGAEMTATDWPRATSLGVLLDGAGIPDPDARGEAVLDDTFLLVLNASPVLVAFVLPGEAWGRCWEVEVDTADPARRAAAPAGTALALEGRSLVLLRRSG